MPSREHTTIVFVKSKHKFKLIGPQSEKTSLLVFVNIKGADQPAQSDQCLCYYPPTKWEGYSFGVVHSVRPFRPSVHTFCLSGTISQYLLVRFHSFLVQMISTMNSPYPISLVKIEPLTLELLPLFKYRQL